MEKRVQNLEEFEAEAARFVRELTPREAGATLVTLSGELGAGKTAFVKAAAKELGVEEPVQSPTFILLKTYPLGSSASKFTHLVHIDAYRLEGGAELAPLRFDELLQDAGALVMLEWPEKVADALPLAACAISIATQESGARALHFTHG